MMKLKLFSGSVVADPARTDRHIRVIGPRRRRAYRPQREKLKWPAFETGNTVFPRPLPFSANSGKRDRAMDVLPANGCMLANYLKNPVVLADHDPSKASEISHRKSKTIACRAW